MWVKGRKNALVDSIVEIVENNGLDIAGNEILLKGLMKLNEKELDELENLISQLGR